MNLSVFLPFNLLLRYQKAWWLLSFPFWHYVIIIILYKWGIEFLCLRYEFLSTGQGKIWRNVQAYKEGVCSFQYVHGDSNILIQTETEISFSRLGAHSQFGFKQLSVGCITSSHSDVQILNCSSLTLNSRIQVENTVSITSLLLWTV